MNFRGEGEIKGGLFIVGKGKTGVAYQFIERNFGDWAPLAEVIEICTRLQVVTTGFFSSVHFLLLNAMYFTSYFVFTIMQNHQHSQEGESTKSSRESESI